MLAPDGTPAAGASVSFSPGYPHRSLGRVSQFGTAGADGTFALRVDANEVFALWVLWSRDGQGYAHSEIVGPDEHDLNVVLEKRHGRL